MLALAFWKPGFRAVRRPHAPCPACFAEDFSAQPVGVGIDPFADGDVDAVVVDLGDLGGGGAEAWIGALDTEAISSLINIRRSLAASRSLAMAT